MNRRLFYITFFSFSLMAILYAVALVYGLFFYWWWFDIPMHFLGGFFAGCLVLLIFSKKFPVGRDLFLAGFFGALLIGVAWEFFEYLTGLAFIAQGNYTFDTIKDYLMDSFGALFAYAVAVRILAKVA